jgi:Outer membrane protein beta-barrel domain
MRWILAACMTVFLLPLVVDAQSVQFGLGATVSSFGYNENEIDTSRVFWGGHARLRIIKFLGAEGSLQYREDNFDFREGDIQLQTTPLQLSGVVYPLGMFPVTPYFLGGTGWYFLKATIRGDLDLPFVFGEGTIEVTETAPHIGIGVEAFIGEHFSFGADARKVFLDFETSLINYKVDAYFVNVGATFYF